MENRINAAERKINEIQAARHEMFKTGTGFAVPGSPVFVVVVNRRFLWVFVNFGSIPQNKNKSGNINYQPHENAVPDARKQRDV